MSIVGTESRRRLALSLTTLTGLVTLALAAALVADYIAARQQAARYQSRLDELLPKLTLDAAFAPQVQTEYDRQAAATLARQARQDSLAVALLIAGAAFVASCKWLMALRGPRSPFVATFATRVAAAPAGGKTPARAAAAPERTSEAAGAAADLSPVDAIIAREGRGRQAAIPVLQAIQAHYGYLPEAALRRVCELTEITPAALIGVASFHTQFRHRPIGKHLIRVCHGTACHVAGAPRLTDELRRYLGIAPGEDTDAARRFTIETVACLGCCTLAPVVQVDGVTHGHLRSDTVLELAQPRAAAQGDGGSGGRRRTSIFIPTGGVDGEIRIGLGSCCIAAGSRQVQQSLQAALSRSGVRVVVKRVGCVGMCHQTPLVEVDVPGQAPARYARVRPEHAAAIIRRHFKSATWAGRVRNVLAGTVARFRDGPERDLARRHRLELNDPPVAAFFGPQRHIATEQCGCLDPADLDEYLRHDGFVALRNCLRQLTPEQVIEQIRHSGLRGRGGAGFPTAEKWARVRAAPGSLKYVVCNGDEGDPGAFMDRMLMESYPYRVIEGIAIGAYATGATEGYLYVRREYALAAERLRAALRECEQRGLLGDRMCGTNHHLHLHLFEGAGAFVCGEETALIASLEGRRGMPRHRPPYPAECGLWGRPTLVSNVETFVVVPWILRNGPASFAALGTQTSRGTKVFALAGKVRRGGLIEVPMGISIRQIVEEIGGGIRDGRRLKAVQIGGPSGGCVPAELADTPVDYEALRSAGAMMGSGGLVVLDESDCMVDIARYFLSFTQSQSCGQCAPCRVGTRRMLDILERLCAGRGRPEDLQKLEHLAQMVAQTSLCGLGRTAPNPVLTTLRYFRDEYEAHLRGRCPARRCPALVQYAVTDACAGCTICAQYCPADAIDPRPYEQHEIDPDKCTRCDACRIRCPEDAIIVVDREAGKLARD